MEPARFSVEIRARDGAVPVVTQGLLRHAYSKEVSPLRRNIYLRQDVLPVGERKSIFAVSPRVVVARELAKGKV